MFNSFPNTAITFIQNVPFNNMFTSSLFLLFFMSVFLLKVHFIFSLQNNKPSEIVNVSQLKISRKEHYTKIMLLEKEKLQGSTFPHSYQFWSQLVIRITVAQSAIASLTPTVQFTTGRNGGTVGPTTGYVHNLFTSETLDYTRSLTLPEKQIKRKYY